MDEQKSPPTPKESASSEKDIGLLFLANFVHQVVNPISGVIGTLDNVVDDTYKGDKAKQVVNACRAQLEQCVSLIRNLAFLSDFFFEKSEKNELRPARQTATSILPQVIIEALQFFQSAAENKSIKIELVDSSVQYRVHARPELLKQIFINLFDNWLKYGLARQTIKILTSVNSKNELCVEISGTSIGFNNSDAERIFDMGYRSKEAQGKVAQGSGIGLFICKKITNDILEGKITAVHSAKSSKTTFNITIPKKLWQI